MKILEANISEQVFDFLNENLKRITHFEIANQKLFDISSITNFFDDPEEFLLFKEEFALASNIVGELDRSEYGDFQTNQNLAKSVASFLKENGANPKIIVEPTCGKGNFIVASLTAFPYLKKIIGIEIYKPYVWETKFNIIQFYLDNSIIEKPIVEINHFNVFNFDFKEIANEFRNEEILVVGNPPWVTNSKLGSLESDNLPRKSNFKNHAGYDAMTGKGNFDIGEYITLMIFDAFEHSKGHFAFLVKNAVIKNVVFDQQQRSYTISDLRKLTIDSKKEFNVSVESALFFCRLNTPPEYYCTEFNFYDPSESKYRFGWVGEKFVSNIGGYLHANDIDGICPFEWRQGIKHDLSSIMELDKFNGHYINGLNDEVKLEDGLIYGFLKSSDLKNTIINQTRKFTIVTQRKVGQDTNYIKSEFPKTYQYLTQHQERFHARKSSIYNNKPLFSIFGIGDYSFKPYKVAISGFYKTFHFTLVLPQGNKPVMLDDTCYLIGFEKIEFAVYALILLNADATIQFLQSITFADAKRTFTKDILMRIDLLALAKNINNDYLQIEITRLNEIYSLNLTVNLWDNFINEMTPQNHTRMPSLF